MPEVTMDPRAEGFVVSEANGSRSREVITVASGNNLKAGAVLGKITASGKYADHDPAAADGTEVAAGVLRDAVDASSADTKGVAFVRDAEVNAAELVWITGISAPNIAAGIADLAGLGIIAR